MLFCWFTAIDEPDDTDPDDDDDDSAGGGVAGAAPDEEAAGRPQTMAVRVIEGGQDGMPWLPFHSTAEYVEVGSHRKHFIVLIDLPAGVAGATDDSANVSIHLTSGGKTLVVKAKWPKIMMEEGMVVFHSRWKERGTSFHRMMTALDTATVALKQKHKNGEIAGIFELPLPFPASKDITTTWIKNVGDECRLIHIDLAIATLEVDNGKVVTFEQVGDEPDNRKRAAKKSI